MDNIIFSRKMKLSVLADDRSSPRILLAHLCVASLRSPSRANCLSVSAHSDFTVCCVQRHELRPKSLFWGQNEQNQISLTVLGSFYAVFYKTMRATFDSAVKVGATCSLFCTIGSLSDDFRYDRVESPQTGTV